MKEIGGYFELQIPQNNTDLFKEQLAVNFGRAGLEIIVKKRGYKTVLLPDYICPVVNETLNKLNVHIVTYAINSKLEPTISTNNFDDDVGFLYVNYFGVKGKFSRKIITECKNLILDLTQAFYFKDDNKCDFFNSTRKFFGVPDGGFVSFRDGVDLDIDLEQSYSWDKCEHLLKRLDIGANEGYQSFIQQDSNMDMWSPKKMSKLTSSLLCSIDIDYCAKIRKDNFNFLHDELNGYNELALDIDEDIPMVYPLMLNDASKLRANLIKNNIFCAKYWPNITTNEQFEDKIIPLPIDQRYTCVDMEYIVSVLKKII